MSLPESELPSTQRAWPARHNKAQSRTALAQGPFALADNRVLTFSEWCAFNSFSQRTGRRLIKRGDGPTITQLSPKRIGITVANDRDWKAARARGRHER